MTKKADAMPGSHELWTDGLICAFEFKPSSLRFGHRNKPLSVAHDDGEREGGHWVPIGWARILEIVPTVQADEDYSTVADLAARPVWWCHVSAEHPSVKARLDDDRWLHRDVSLSLKDETQLISDRMKPLLYEVPIRVHGGLLFELLGQSVGNEGQNDIPIVLRSWQDQNFLVTVLHIKGHVSSANVSGITEVLELLSHGGHNVPTTIHEVIAHLTSRLARWDYRLFRKSIFGAVDELGLKFMYMRNHKEMNLFSKILNEEIKTLSNQVIRVKWSLHAREEILSELLDHLRGNITRSLLKKTRKSTREMIEEQEEVRGRLFLIQDVMQSNVDASIHRRLGVYGGCGLVLSIITGLLGINVDGVPGAKNAPYAFGIFSAILLIIGCVISGLGNYYLRLKKPISKEQVQARKRELEDHVKRFQYEVETHAPVGKTVHRNYLPSTMGDAFTVRID
ncbi:PREDICTED: uncharacterized protein LOC101294894 [Fragaria vesca subsp. vesca]